MTKGKLIKKDMKEKRHLIKLFHLDRELPSFIYPEGISIKDISDVFCDKFNDVSQDTSNVYDGIIDEIKYMKESPKSNVKKIYFKIVKIKKRGKRRIKDASILHDKNSEYNIICKIKVYFTKSLLEQANNLFFENSETKETNDFFKNYWLKPINPKEENNLYINWFFKTAKEYLSSNITNKCATYPNDYNRKEIEKVYKENKNKKLITFLDQKVSSIYKEYINNNNDENNLYKGMRKFKDDLQKIKMKYSYEDNYIKKVEKISFDLENIFLRKKNKTQSLPEQIISKF